MPFQEDLNRARQILSGQEAVVRDIFQLAKALMATNHFGHARKLLAKARVTPEGRSSEWRELLTQKHAIATYKDPDLPPEQKFERAWEILSELFSDNNSQVRQEPSQETLGIAGAIFKRRWEVSSQSRHLERSLAYYLRGYKQGVAPDKGYTAINAAFVYDLLASQEQSAAILAGAKSETSRFRCGESKRIREDIIQVLKQFVGQLREWWFFATLAEAHFGLGIYQPDNYDNASELMKEASSFPNVADWERESTVRQLATLLRLQRSNGLSLQDQERARQAIRSCFEQSRSDAAIEEAVNSVLTGKVGLALSGGGFRASLFHIGVLAKLAELDLLRHIEALSCVSGGSIVGAYYYLELRNLLRTVGDRQISRQHYVTLVETVRRNFSEGVKSNIRTTVAAEFITNLRMMFQSNYSRTHRLGELYEKKLYSRINDGEGDRPRLLGKLRIEPENQQNFNPKRDNWTRRAKIPVLILNATALNTGHNWQFTASYMGEPPSPIDAAIDGNYRLRRMYHPDAPKPHGDLRLGYAVAASSCVPGLFAPLSLDALYPDRTVCLVDGGVFDNQGTTSLSEQGCSVLFVSDASGQMDVQDSPKCTAFGVLMRSATISQTRVRTAQYSELESRRRASAVQAMLFVHLKKDLQGKPVDWIGCPDPYGAEDAVLSEKEYPVTCFGIAKQLQRHLAAIRTDLDSFADGEASTLMLSGYLQTEHELMKNLTAFKEPFSHLTDDLIKKREDRAFLAFADSAQSLQSSSKLYQLLKVARNRTLKVWHLLPFLRRLAWTTSVGLGLLLLYTRQSWQTMQVLTLSVVQLDFSFTLTLGAVVFVLLIVAGMRFMVPLVLRLVGWRKTFEEFAVGAGASMLGCFLARLHLWVFDRLYLRFGSKDSILKKSQ